jgi:hypothetical protein
MAEATEMREFLLCRLEKKRRETSWNRINMVYKNAACIYASAAVKVYSK